MAEQAAGRIIVLDDDESVCRALARLLRSYGYEVSAFASAGALLASGLPEDTCCLVLDVRMPEMGGVELAEHLHASGRRVPTVFVTAHETEDLRSLALQGAPVLQKPVDAGRLIAAIDAASGGGAARRGK
jgi:FixJ family two-component response regulator